MGRHISSAKTLIEGLQGLCVVAHGIKSAFNEVKSKENFKKHFNYINQSLEVRTQTFGFALSGKKASINDFIVIELPANLLVCSN